MPFEFNKYPDPANLPAGNCDNVAFSSGGNTLVATAAVAPFIQSYNIDGGAHTFARTALPAADLGGAGVAPLVRPDNAYVYAAWSGSGGLPRLAVYSMLAGVLTKQANPSIPNVTSNYTPRDLIVLKSNTLLLAGVTALVRRFTISGAGLTLITDQDVADRPAGTVRGMDYSKDEQFIGVVHATAPYLTFYKLEASNALTKLPGQSGGLALQPNGIAFHPSLPIFAIGYSGSPYVSIHEYDTDGNVTQIATLPAPGGVVHQPRWHPSGEMLAVVGGFGARVMFWMFREGVFTQFSPAGTYPTYHCFDMEFSDNGLLMAIASRDATKLHLYDVIPEPDEITSDVAAVFPKMTAKATGVVLDEPDPPIEVSKALVSRTVALDAAPLVPSEGDAGHFGYVRADFPALAFDGAAGTVPDVELSATFPSLAASVRAGIIPKFTGEAVFPALSASVAGYVDVKGPLDAVFPALTLAAEGVVPSDLAILKASFPALTAEIVSLRPEGGWIYANFPALSADIAAQRNEGAWLDASFPALAAEIAAERQEGVWLAATFPALSADALGGPDATAVVEGSFPRLAADIAVRRGYNTFVSASFPALTAELVSVGAVGGFLDAEFPALSASVDARFRYAANIDAVFPGLRFDARPPDPVDAELTATFPALGFSGYAGVTVAGQIAAVFPKLSSDILIERSRRVDANLRFPKLSASVRAGQTVEGRITASFPALEFAGTYRRYYGASIDAGFPALRAETEALLLYRTRIEAAFPALLAAVSADWDTDGTLDASFPALALEVSVKTEYKALLSAAFPALRFAARTAGEPGDGGFTSGPNFTGSGDTFNIGGGIVFSTSKTWQLG